jgi:glycosyltransferase involved in cell wall biosynthesis
MRIAHVICSFYPYKSGMGNSVASFARELLPFKHEVTVITPNFRSREETVGDWNGVKILRLKPLLSIGSGAILPSIIKELKNYDLVHLHYPFYGTAELVAIAKILNPRKIKLILHYHMDTRGRGLKSLIYIGYRKFWLPLLLRLADEITCASLDYVKHSDIGAYYKKHYQKFTQVPFGVDLEHFKNCHPPDGLANNILFVGALDRQHYFKGVDKLIEALPAVISAVPDATLTIVGRGDLEDAYRQMAQDARLGDKVIFINDASDDALVEYYSQASLLVLPSINQSEAFGLVLLEAMACGKPVIAANLPGVRSVFTKGLHGLRVQPGDVKDLSAKIIFILTHKTKADAMGSAARTLVEKRYSWSVAGAKLNEIYYRVRYVPANKLKVGK